MILSPFTPLFFPRQHSDGINSRYVQTFALGDQILVEILAEKDTIVSARLYSEPEHKDIYDIEFSTWAINSSTDLHFAVLSPSIGHYSVEIDGIGRSDLFRVTDDGHILSKTTLIQYSMNSNRHRTDAVFFIDGMQRFFDFRVPGGFKQSNWAFSVEGEQFVTDKSDIVQLYGLESTQQKFTLGNSEGCPVWFAELLNRLLCCTYVYFDGVRYARKDTAAPEITVLIDGINSFVFSQNLQRVNNIDPTLTLQHQALIRRVGTERYRLANNNMNRIIR